MIPPSPDNEPNEPPIHTGGDEAEITLPVNPPKLRTGFKGSPFGDEPDNEKLKGLRSHSYYNEKNAQSYLLLMEEWRKASFIDSQISAKALGLKTDSLRMKLVCARLFALDNLPLAPEIREAITRNSFKEKHGVIIMTLGRLASSEREFTEAFKPLSEEPPEDPITAFSRWLQRDGLIPRALFTLKEVDLTPAQQEWFRQALARLKDNYEGDVQRNQIVVIRLTN